jgi:alpha-L-arabinofuranosidase
MASVTEVNGPDIKSENNFDQSPVKPSERQAGVDGKKLRVRLSPHSYTMVKVKVG